MRLFESLADQDSVFVYEKAPGVGHTSMAFFNFAVIGGPLLLDCDVQQPNLGDDDAALITEQRICDPM